MRASRALLTLLVLACVAAFVTAAQAEEIRVRSGLAAEDVLLGDAVGMTILVEGTDSAEGPTIESFGDEFEVRFDGSAPSRRTSVSTINGRTTRHDEVSVTMEYTLRPRRAGELLVPSLVVRAGGEEFRTPERTVRVIGPRPTEVASLALTSVPQRVYVEQPFDLVLSAGIQAAQFEDTWYEGDPWFAGRPPELRVPWFQELDGFQASDAREFVGSLLAGAGESGFRINGIAQRVLLGEPRALRFKLPRRQEIRGGRQRHMYELRRTFVPLRAGHFEIPPSTLTGDTIQTLQRVRGQLQADETEAVFVTHPEVSIDVLPVPTDGAPPTYSHAVGRYRVAADVQPRRVKVGDPMTLTLTVTGAGLLERVAAPRLDRQPGLAEDFQVAEPDPARSEGTGRVFTFTFRPRRAGVTRVPALELASFDPESESFVVARTDPIPVEVESAQAVTASEVEMSGGGRPVESTPGDEIEGGVLGNFGDEEMLGDERFDPLGALSTWLLLGVPPLLLGASVALARRRDALAADPAGRRARAALQRALEMLGDARGALDRGSPRDAAAALHATLAGYVAARTRRAAGTLTAADVAGVFTAAGIASPAAEEIVATLEACEAARFGGSSPDLPDRVDAAAGWLRSVERERLS